jgi:hypothetical protein
MRVRIDTHQTPKPKRRLVPAPVEVKPPRVRIYLNRDSVLRAGREDFFDVDLVI